MLSSQKLIKKTYEFIEACKGNWGIEITWIEYQGKKHEERFKVVTFETASHTHKEIIELAAYIALENLESQRQQSKLQTLSMNE